MPGWHIRYRHLNWGLGSDAAAAYSIGSYTRFESDALSALTTCHLMLLRDALPADFPRILQLNHELVHFLSPMDAGRLVHLAAQAIYHRVVEIDGRVVAFLLAFREGSGYDSPNYLWFERNYAAFVYIDRVVVAPDMQGRRIGNLLYDDVFAFAKATHVECVTCEFYVDPPNEVSRRFHARYGFEEVGSQSLPGGKCVSMQMKHVLE